jgi:hypothetical protein
MGQALTQALQQTKEARMQSRFEMIEDLSGRRSLVFACAAFIFYGSTMLAVLLFARPLDSDAAAAKPKAPAAEASATGQDPAKSFWQTTPQRGEHTVSRPNPLKPASAAAATPFKQF